MRKVRVWCELFEHDEYGSCLVWLTWKRLPGVRELYAPKVVSVQFDLLTPLHEQQKLLSCIEMAERGTFGDSRV